MYSNQELIHEVSKGNKTAFRQLYVLFSDQVYNTAISYTKNKEEAEEITQDVFIKIHQNASKFESNSKVSTWIYRITINTSLNVIKKNKKFKSNTSLQETDPIDFEHPGVLLEKKENAKTLFRHIDSLSDNRKPHSFSAT